MTYVHCPRGRGAADSVTAGTGAQQVQIALTQNIVSRLASTERRAIKKVLTLQLALSEISEMVDACQRLRPRPP